MPEGACLLARVPVCGTRDAGRGFLKELRGALVGAGRRENAGLPAIFFFSRNGKVLAVLGAHVDDVLYAALPEAEEVTKKAKDAFVWGSEDSKNFIYSGKATSQDYGFSISVS